MAFKLDPQKIEESYGVIHTSANEQLAEAVNDLASVLIPEKGTNSLVDELLDKCKTVQNNYNGQFLPAINDLLNNFSETFEISEYLAKKASVGDVNVSDVSFNTEKISAEDVIM